MMWNGWLPTTRGLIPGMDNNETLYYAAADRLVESGLRDLGYDTVAATCHGWQRDPETHKLRANPITWPRGYKALVDYLHARGLKIATYSDVGENNCFVFNGTKEPGMLGHEELDMQTFKEWGVDHITVDACYVPNRSRIFEYQRIHDAMFTHLMHQVNKACVKQMRPSFTRCARQCQEHFRCSTTHMRHSL